MKRKLFTFVSILFILIIGGIILSMNASHNTNELFLENVEALVDDENQYDQKIWYKYYRTDGGFNCTKGGSETC